MDGGQFLENVSYQRVAQVKAGYENNPLRLNLAIEGIKKDNPLLFSLANQYALGLTHHDKDPVNDRLREVGIATAHQIIIDGNVLVGDYERDMYGAPLVTSRTNQLLSGTQEKPRGISLDKLTRALGVLYDDNKDKLGSILEETFKPISYDSDNAISPHSSFGNGLLVTLGLFYLSVFPEATENLFAYQKNNDNVLDKEAA